MKSMKHIFLMVLLFTHTVRSQDLNEYNTQRSKTDQRLMLTLGSWSAINMVGSGIGWATAGEGEARYFHQMNVMWNGVNLALAIPGYLKARKSTPSLSLAQTVDEQHKTEKIFLFNTGLDVAYITSGFYLRSLASSNASDANRLKGFGNSILLQGGFLFLFDITAYCIHNQHRKNKLTPVLDRLSLSTSGIGIRFDLDHDRTPQRSMNPISGDYH